jgi:hypothetical protein
MSPPKDSERGAGTTRNGRGHAGDDDPGILSQLPRTRPQRSSRHRAAARDGSAADAPRTATASAANGHPPVAAKPGARASKKAPPAARSKAARPSATSGAAKSAGTGARGAGKASPRGSRAGGRAGGRAANGAGASTTMPTAPRQGFESDGERATATVHPPGGAELVASAAEIVGELAKAGLSTGERLLKDVLSHLPL